MTGTQQITTILFDVGGVILVPLRPEEVWANRDRMAHELGYASGREMWLDFYDNAIWDAAKTGAMTQEEMWNVVLTPHGLPGREQQAQFVRDLYEGEGMHPPMKTLIITLAQDYRLGILSNFDDTLEWILEDVFGISHHFHAILNSFRIGVAKPDEAAFRIALDRLDARPGEVLFIDDQRRNTKAAAALGFHTHTFTDLPTLTTHLTALSLLND